VSRVLIDLVATGGLALAAAAQLVRWLRVLQREHYDPAATLRFLARWSSAPAGPGPAAALRRVISVSVLAVLAWVGAVATGLTWWAVGVAVVYGVACPRGLGLRGRTGPLRWTRRLSAAAGASVLVTAMVLGAGVALGRPWPFAGAAVFGVPVIVSAAAAALAPFEARRARVFVERAAARLARVRPTVVAITGSYGKTSTKVHLAHLLGSDAGVVASPASFNNRAGLSRAINENLADGTRVFIAEMGTYGPGEIRELCEWCPPDVAVITALGPVHLERMGSLDVIESAKFEVTERARVVVVNVDDERLAQWPERLATSGVRVRRAGSRDANADVRVALEGERWRVTVDGVALADVVAPAGVHATNVACALAGALALGADPSALAERLASLAAVEHRSQVSTAPSGVVVVDDTFNANPQSAAAAVALLTASCAGRRVVVTPGLVELGPAASAANRELGARVAAAGDELVVVGRTNARALADGYDSSSPGPLRARRVAHRDDAVAWVRSSLVAGDGVLYLNDLPDHYP